MAPHLIRIADTRENQTISIHVPTLGPIQVQRRNFTPVAGFIIDGQHSYPDPNLPLNQLSYDWYGTALGTELSFSVWKGVMTARFSQGQHTWVVASDDEGVQVFRRLDLSVFPRDAELDEPSRPTDAGLVPLRIVEPSESRFIDPIRVLVAYTANARTVAGGQAALDSLIAASVADMNQAIVNSNVVSVAMENVMPGGQPGLLLNYNEISNPPPDCFGPASVCNFIYHRRRARENLTSARDLHEADLVVLMVGDTNSCGIAYTQRLDCGFDTNEPGCDKGNAYNSFAYSVVSSNCSISTRTFSHEVGHQFGMEHDRESLLGVPLTPSFQWSFGYHVATPTQQARTIMSYDDNCIPHGCPINLQYSNPNVGFMTHPTVPSGTNTANGQGRSAFNARTISTLATIMTGFRGSNVPDRLFRSSFEALPLP